jgi:hypothetical protein
MVTMTASEITDLASDSVTLTATFGRYSVKVQLNDSVGSWMEIANEMVLREEGPVYRSVETAHREVTLPPL